MAPPTGWMQARRLVRMPDVAHSRLDLGDELAALVRSRAEPGEGTSRSGGEAGEGHGNGEGRGARDGGGRRTEEGVDQREASDGRRVKEGRVRLEK